MMILAGNPLILHRAELVVCSSGLCNVGPRVLTSCARARLFMEGGPFGAKRSSSTTCVQDGLLPGRLWWEGEPRPANHVFAIVFVPEYATWRAQHFALSNQNQAGIQSDPKLDVVPRGHASRRGMN